MTARLAIWLCLLLPVFSLAAIGVVLLVDALWGTPFAGFGFVVGGVFGVPLAAVSFHIAELETNYE